jgi:hypothetical protein
MKQLGIILAGHLEQVRQDIHHPQFRLLACHLTSQQGQFAGPTHALHRRSAGGSSVLQLLDERASTGGDSNREQRGLFYQSRNPPGVGCRSHLYLGTTKTRQVQVMGLQA